MPGDVKVILQGVRNLEEVLPEPTVPDIQSDTPDRWYSCRSVYIGFRISITRMSDGSFEISASISAGGFTPLSWLLERETLFLEFLACFGEPGRTKLSEAIERMARDNEKGTWDYNHANGTAKRWPMPADIHLAEPTAADLTRVRQMIQRLFMQASETEG